MSGIFHMMFNKIAAAIQAAFAVDLDGTNDYLSRASDLTGNADGKTFTFSAWVWNSDDSIGTKIYENGSGRFAITTASNDNWSIVGKDSTGATVLSASVTAPKDAVQTFSHLLVSIDLTNAANRAVYVDDVAATVTWTTYTNTDIDFTQSTHFIGADSAGPSSFTKGRLSNVFLDYTYRDLSVEANRRLFITADRKPAASSATLTSGIIYMPMDDPTTAHVNSGTGGNFTLNGTIARSGRGPNQYNTPYSDLDGAADYLSRTTAPTGIADGGIFTYHVVLNYDVEGTFFQVSANTTSRFRVRLNSAKLEIQGVNSSNTTILAFTSATTFVAGRNYVISISIDLSNTSKRHVYINGVTDAGTWGTYTNDSIDFDPGTPRYYVAATNNGTPSYDGRLGDVFFHTSYVDLSVADNLAKFVTGTGIDAKPVDLGSDGSTPLGVQPLIYCPMYANNAGKNYGSGGDYTVNSGPYTGARGANEFWGNKATFNGTTANIAKTSQLTGAADGKVFLLSFHVNKNASTLYTICDTTGAAFRVTINASNQLVVVAENSSGTTILSATTTTTIANTTNTHVMISIDLASASNRAIYFNGAAATVTWTTYTNDSIDFTVADFYVGSETGSANFFAGWLAEFFLALPAAYIDITSEATRLKYADAFSNPVDKGTDGSTPTGTAPIVYLRFPPTDFGTNAGTGGALTSVNVTDGGQL